jgi:integrase
MARKPNYADLFTLRKDGRYMATYTDELGVRRSLYDRDPERLYQKLQARFTEEPPPVTFGDVAQDWERWHREEISQRTWNNYLPHYRDILTKHGKKPVEQVGAPDVIAHLTAAKAQGYSATVVDSIRSLYRMIFDHAVANDHAKYNPVSSVRLPKGLKRSKRQAPTDDQIRTIFTSTHLPFGLFPFLLLCTGLRKSEALALTWDDVDLTAKEISVTKSLDYPTGSTPVVKPPKTEAGYRTVPIVDVLCEKLQEAKAASGSPYLFPSQDSNRAGKGGGMMSLRGYDGAWERYCRAAGLMDGDHPAITAHNLRHGTATLMFEMNVDELTAQRILGHSRVEITREIYTDLREKQNQKSVKKFNAGLNKYARQPSK